MLCVLINHNYAYETQVIAQIFFPVASFSFTQNMADIYKEPGYAALMRIDFNGGELCYTGEIYLSGALLADHCSWRVHANGLAKDYLTEKHLLMLSLFNAFKKVFDISTPWGALTGVRPSKLVRGWLGDGYDEGEIAAFLIDGIYCKKEKASLALTVAKSEMVLTRKIWDMAMQNNKTPAGLYIGIPFCPSRCLYCSFNINHIQHTEATHHAYLDALDMELEKKMDQAKEQNLMLTSIYIGGGTPTVLNEKNLDRLLNMVLKYELQAIKPLEFTVEAGRPDSISPEKLQMMKGAGVNRIAINPQTLKDETLAIIGRRHSARDFFTAYGQARAVGFDHINVDVIIGLPNEGSGDVEHTMEGIVGLKPENITIHTLAVKRSSRLNERLDDYPHPAYMEINGMLETANDMCIKSGMAPYYMYRQKNMMGLLENVGYSIIGKECLYNIGMMAEVQTIIGAGAGAVTKHLKGADVIREYNVKNPEIYIQRTMKPTG